MGPRVAIEGPEMEPKGSAAATASPANLPPQMRRVDRFRVWGLGLR